jgi:hypothetical protein
VCTVALYIGAALLSLVLESAQDAFEVLISIGAGTGLLYLLRWFWWRINAWCEVVAMASSFAVSVALLALRKTGHGLPFAEGVLCAVAFTTVCWLVAAFAGAPTSRERLIAFYKKVHPAGPGWKKIRIEAGVTTAEAARQGDHMGKAALGWICGCAAIWSSLFALGDFLYGRTAAALALTGVFVVSGAGVIAVINTLWDKGDGSRA